MVLLILCDDNKFMKKDVCCDKYYKGGKCLYNIFYL